MKWRSLLRLFLVLVATIELSLSLVILDPLTRTSPRGIKAGFSFNDSIHNATNSTQKNKYGLLKFADYPSDQNEIRKEEAVHNMSIDKISTILEDVRPNSRKNSSKVQLKKYLLNNASSVSNGTLNFERNKKKTENIGYIPPVYNSNNNLGHKKQNTFTNLYGDIKVADSYSLQGTKFTKLTSPPSILNFSPNLFGLKTSTSAEPELLRRNNMFHGTVPLNGNKIGTRYYFRQNESGHSMNLFPFHNSMHPSIEFITVHPAQNINNENVKFKLPIDTDRFKKHTLQKTVDNKNKYVTHAPLDDMNNYEFPFQLFTPTVQSKKPEANDKISVDNGSKETKVLSSLENGHTTTSKEYQNMTSDSSTLSILGSTDLKYPSSVSDRTYQPQRKMLFTFQNSSTLTSVNSQSLTSMMSSKTDFNNTRSVNINDLLDSYTSESPGNLSVERDITSTTREFTKDALNLMPQLNQNSSAKETDEKSSVGSNGYPMYTMSSTDETPTSIQADSKPIDCDKLCRRICHNNVELKHPAHYGTFEEKVHKFLQNMTEPVPYTGQRTIDSYSEDFYLMMPSSAAGELLNAPSAFVLYTYPNLSRAIISKECKNSLNKTVTTKSMPLMSGSSQVTLREYGTDFSVSFKQRTNKQITQKKYIIVKQPYTLRYNSTLSYHTKNNKKSSTPVPSRDENKNLFVPSCKRPNKV